MSDRHRFTIVLQAGPSCTDELATRQLRGLLKTALRGFGLRCVSVEPSRADQTAQNQITNPLSACGTDGGSITLATKDCTK